MQIPEIPMIRFVENEKGVAMQTNLPENIKNPTSAQKGPSNN